MNLYKKRYLYANGSSITAGGGFEPSSHRKDNVRSLYKLKGIELPETQVECSYPYFIAKQLNLELINDAKSGSGIDRLIRTTFNWIQDNPEKVEQTLFVLESQPGIRLDLFVSEWNDYGVMNGSKIDGKYGGYIVKNWFLDDQKEQTAWNKKYEVVLNDYLNNFYDQDEQYISEIRRLIAFFGFLNEKKIDYVTSLPSSIIKYRKELINMVPRKSNLSYLFERELPADSHQIISEPWTGVKNINIWSFAEEKKLLIYHDIDNRDNHIGYKGNQLVADLIVDYIKNYETIKYTKLGTGPFYPSFTKCLPIKFQNVENTEDADFVYLDEGFIWQFRNIHTVPKIEDVSDKIRKLIKDIDTQIPILRSMDKTNKKFLVMLLHERVTTDIFVKWLRFMDEEYNIKRSQIWYVDINPLDYPLANPIPLELKIKNFATIENFDVHSDNNRNKKICSLTHRISPTRLLVFDRILSEYSDHEVLQRQNIISFLDAEDNSIEKLINERNLEYKLKNKVSRYKELNLPWYVDDKSLGGMSVPRHQMDNFLASILSLYKQSIISIVCETEISKYHDMYLHNPHAPYTAYGTLTEIQFSEKCLLPIIGGSFLFVITDGSFYRNMEKIGFDFGYLKKVFDIDYMTNTHYENILEVSKIAKFTANRSIGELNEIRNQNYNYIEHNRKLLSDIMFGDSTENELKFWEQLSNKSLT